MKRNLIHCSYHKCLTVYYMMVVSNLYNKIFRFNDGYNHFNSLVDELYERLDEYRIASVNNHALDFEKLGDDWRISRFIRDPRDLVVSGYLYHKKGTEDWCKIENPTDEEWQIVNGAVPENMLEGYSYASYLQSVSKEEGLLAEIDFRKYHFESMRKWPISDDRIILFRYKDIMGNETDVFEKIFLHYGLSWPERKIGKFLAHRLSADNKSDSSDHIRNPTSGQWKEHFTPKVEKRFNDQYGDLLEHYGY